MLTAELPKQKTTLSQRTSALATITKLELALSTLEGIKKNLPRNVTRIDSLQRIIRSEIEEKKKIAESTDETPAGK